MFNTDMNEQHAFNTICVISSYFYLSFYFFLTKEQEITFLTQPWLTLQVQMQKQD